MTVSPQSSRAGTTDAFTIRRALPNDVGAISALIERSVAALSLGYYTPEQIVSSTRYVFGVDTQLIADGTYYVVEHDGTLVGAGGWSHRRTLFGGDQMKAARDGRDAMLDPSVSPARIRAFFVDPQWARRGLGRLLFGACEHAAAQHGFRAFELVATLPGEPLYAALGFMVDERFDVALPDGVALPVARMTRPISPA